MFSKPAPFFKPLLFAFVGATVLATVSISPAHAQYSSQQFLRDTRVYTANMLDSLRSTPNSTYNSPYKLGSNFQPVYKQKTQNWNQTYTAPPKPLTYEKKFRQDVERRVEADRQAKLRATQAQNAQQLETARLGQIEFERIIAVNKQYQKTKPPAMRNWNAGRRPGTMPPSCKVPKKPPTQTEPESSALSARRNKVICSRSTGS